MKSLRQYSAITCFVAVAVLFVGGRWANAQDAPPAGVQRLTELMQDPDKLQATMSDPAKLQELMQTVDTDEVRQYLSDPEHLRQLMQNVDPEKMRAAMQNIDPAQVRKAMTTAASNRLKDRLGVTDEEWQVLQPKIEAVMKAQQEAQTQTGRRGGLGGGGFNPLGGGVGPGVGIGAGGPAGNPESDVAKAAAALQAAAREPNTPPPDVKNRLAEYRAAKEKAKQKLETAEKELKALLTARQEGVLMTMGILN